MLNFSSDYANSLNARIKINDSEFDVLLEKKLISEEELEYFRKHKVLTKTGIISLDKTE